MHGGQVTAMSFNFKRAAGDVLDRGWFRLFYSTHLLNVHTAESRRAKSWTVVPLVLV